MSKTFKALQRAAQERAAKMRRKEEPLKPGEGLAELPTDDATLVDENPVSPEIDRAARELELPSNDVEAVLPVELDAEAARNGNEAPTGEFDALLQNLLKEAFVGGSSGLVRVESDGWVRGSLDLDQVRLLLSRYALLHCLHQDEDNSFWFWSSTRDARERAQRTGLPLDLDEPDAD